jgi:hypothetical protein
VRFKPTALAAMCCVLSNGCYPSVKDGQLSCGQFDPCPVFTDSDTQLVTEYVCRARSDGQHRCYLKKDSSAEAGTNKPSADAEVVGAETSALCAEEAIERFDASSRLLTDCSKGPCWSGYGNADIDLDTDHGFCTKGALSLKLRANGCGSALYEFPPADWSGFSKLSVSVSADRGLTAPQSDHRYVFVKLASGPNGRCENPKRDTWRDDATTAAPIELIPSDGAYQSIDIVLEKGKPPTASEPLDPGCSDALDPSSVNTLVLGVLDAPSGNELECKNSSEIPDAFTLFIDDIVLIK